MINYDIKILNYSLMRFIYIFYMKQYLYIILLCVLKIILNKTIQVFIVINNYIFKKFYLYIYRYKIFV
jgi:hypothetical protein